MQAKAEAFCLNYVLTGNLTEAAYKAGYRRHTDKAVRRLLSDAEVIARIRTLSATVERCAPRAVTGLRRLAFASPADAVRMLYDEPGTEDKQLLDLSCVSEIKRPRPDCMEIKFYDRVRALAALAQIETRDDGALEALMDSLRGEAGERDAERA